MKQLSFLSMSRVLFAVAFFVPQVAFSQTQESETSAVSSVEPLQVQQTAPSPEPVVTAVVAVSPPVAPSVAPSTVAQTTPSTPVATSSSDLTPTGEVKDSDYAPVVDKPMNPMITQTQDEILRQGLSPEQQTLFDILDQCRTAQAKCLSQAGGEVFSPYDRELRDDLIAFYKNHNFQPVWIKDGAWNEAVHQFFQSASLLEKEGLSPHYYGLNQTILSQGVSATADIRLSKAILWVLKDLKQGATRTTYKDQMTIISEKNFNPVDMLNKVLAKTTPWTAEEIHAFSPTNSYYQGLYKALSDLRQQQQKGGWVFVPNANNTKQLKARLYQSGDYKPVEPKELSSAVMTPALKKGISSFQRRHGFVETGQVDTKTLGAMNVSIEERIEQILLNMERARWLSDEIADRALFVNIPDFRLEILEKGKPIHSMAVIIGRPDRQTPMFEDTMTYIEFNPYWNVPPRLAVHDISKLARTGSFKAHGYRVFYKGNEVDAAGVPWNSFSERNFPYRVRQDPGKHNQLGSVKFMFPNPFAVYLHDTPKKKLFDKHERYQSSGCIRVQEPRWLANYLLKSQMDETRVTEIFDKGKNRQVRLDAPVPVSLMYFTTWIDRDGNLAFREDVYERDPLMRRAITKLRTRGVNAAAVQQLPTISFASLQDITVRKEDKPVVVIVPKKIMIERPEIVDNDLTQIPAQTTAIQPQHNSVSIQKASTSYNVKLVSADFKTLTAVSAEKSKTQANSSHPQHNNADSVDGGLENVYFGASNRMEPIH